MNDFLHGVLAEMFFLFDAGGPLGNLGLIVSENLQVDELKQVLSSYS